ncbi:class I SAM-dependent methyltransferase [Paraburkholderia sp. IMGN_8]|uniref:class I SAM-dependent methyltransferase n=1 Tax=Paraburkholderia sp. IMGN_8 TaxID=3136564 RepID=UPI0031015408
MNTQLQSELDRVNRIAWNSPDATREFTTEKTFSDPGEQAAFDWIGPRCAGQPLLDIGIGAGRTIPLMTAISSDYTGVDYTLKLLEMAKARYPGLDLRHMDARDMSALPSAHYGLVEFSWNGIDCVDYDDRVKILKEMYRVLRPGGYLLFSTHNRGGPGYSENLWQLLPEFTFNPLKLGWRTLRSLRRFQLGTLNYMRNVRLNHDYGSYALKTAAAHNFGIVIVYTTLAEQRRQLAEVGFQSDAVFGSCEGERIPDDVETSSAWWFHFIAHKPVAACRFD